MVINIKKEFEFIFASRFIALVIGATAFYLKTKGWIGDAEMNFIGTITGGFITVKTVDKFASNVGTITTSTITDKGNKVATTSITKPIDVNAEDVKRVDLVEPLENIK